MNGPFTPKQIARAIDVSESSVKRWCDQGVIETTYTPGGHRRVSRSTLMAFLKNSGRSLAKPEVLGLPAASGSTRWVLDRAADHLASALLAGDEERCRRIVIDLYLAEHDMASICDHVFAAAFEKIGDQWECGAAEIYQERRGCQIAVRTLNELRTFSATPPADAPLALGAAPVDDQYQLGTTMAELVLRDAGWNAVSLGANLPFATIAAAIKKSRPRLFWLSCSHIQDEAAFLQGCRNLYDEFAGKAAFVVGGRAFTDAIRSELGYSAYCEDMQRLAAFALSLRAAEL